MLVDHSLINTFSTHRRACDRSLDKLWCNCKVEIERLCESKRVKTHLSKFCSDRRCRHGAWEIYFQVPFNTQGAMLARIALSNIWHVSNVITLDATPLRNELFSSSWVLCLVPIWLMLQPIHSWSTQPYLNIVLVLLTVVATFVRSWCLRSA